jgi:hypothetical protein
LFKVQAGNHFRKAAIAKMPFLAGIVSLKACSHNQSRGPQGGHFLFLIQTNSPCRTIVSTQSAPHRFRPRLLLKGQALILVDEECLRYVGRGRADNGSGWPGAALIAYGAGRAFIFVNKARLLSNLNFEPEPAAIVPLHFSQAHHFGAGQKVNSGQRCGPFELIFGQADTATVALFGSLAAKLQNMAADTWFFFDNIHLVAVISQGEGRTDPGNPTADNNGLILIVQGLKPPSSQKRKPQRHREKQALLHYKQLNLLILYPVVSCLI